MNVQIADGRINAPGDGDNVWLGSFSEVGVRNREVCFAPSNRHRQPGQTCRKGADTVEKVENRKTPKISQKLIFGQVRRWDVHSANTKVRGRFSEKRGGLSRK